MIKTLLIGFFTVVLLGLTTTGHAVVPQFINYQGKLNDSGGNPVNADVNITFTLYSDASGTDLPDPWTETHAVVSVTNGIFEVELGSVVGFPADTFLIPLWLGIEVNPDSEMVPRQPLLTSPFAFQAEVAETAEAVKAGAIDTTALATGAVDTDNIQAGAVTAAKIDSTGLDADSVDGVQGAQIITTTGGGVINNANLELQGTATLIFADGSIQTTASFPDAGGPPDITVTCPGVGTPLQDALDALGPGGSVTIEISGVCTESIVVRRTRVNIVGDGIGGTDGITGTGSEPAVKIDRPAILWMSGLTINGNGNNGIYARRNASVVLYPDIGNVVLTGSDYGALVQWGAYIGMFGTQANGNSLGSLLMTDGAAAQLSDVVFNEDLNTGAPDWATTISLGRGSAIRIDGVNTEITNSPGSGDRVVIEAWQKSSLRINDAKLIEGQIWVDQQSTASIRNITNPGLTGAIAVWQNSWADLRNVNLVPDTSFGTIDVSGGSNLTIRNGTDVEATAVDVYSKGYLTFRNDAGTFQCTGAPGSCNVNVGNSHLNVQVPLEATVNINNGSQLDLSANLTDPDLNVTQHSRLLMHAGAVVTGNVHCNQSCILNGWNGQITGQVNVQDSSRFFFSNSMTSVDGPINVGGSSSLNVENGVTFGTGVPTLWPGGPVINVDRSSDLSIDQNVVITGGLNVSQGAAATVNDGAEITGDLGVFNSSIAHLDNGVTVGGDISIGSRSEMNINGIISPTGDIFLNENSSIFVQDGATLNLTDDIFFDKGSHVTLRNGATVARASNSDQAFALGLFSTLTLQDNATVKGSINVKDMSSVDVFANNVTFDGDLNFELFGSPSSANFNGPAAPLFTIDHGINCFNGSGNLRGNEPTFSGTGGIDPNCNDFFDKTLTFSAEGGSGTGTVTSSFGLISCATGPTGVCSDTFTHNSVVGLTATPDGSDVFGGWGGDDACTALSGSPDNLTMDTNKNCTATFNAPP